VAEGLYSPASMSVADMASERRGLCSEITRRGSPKRRILVTSNVSPSRREATTLARDRAAFLSANTLKGWP
jgi:hypothetical protein